MQGLEITPWQLPRGALLCGTGALCTSAHAQLSKGITLEGIRCQSHPGAKASSSSLLGYQQFLVNCVSQRKRNQAMPVPAFVALPALSGSVVVGADFLLLVEPL